MIDFVINHFHRAGSTYLQNLLGSHREILCLFRPFGTDLYGHRKNKDEYLNQIYYLGNEERLRKLSRTYLYHKDWRWIKKNIDNWDKIFSECSVGSSSMKVGVKFSFDEYHNHKDLYEYVKNTTGPYGTKVIFLKRRNLLRQVYSYYKALHGHRDDWVYWDPNEKIEKKVYRFTENWLRRTFDIVEDYYKRYEHIPHLRVDYEDLLDDRDEELSRIYKYLGVDEDPDYKPLVPLQQNTYHMSEVIENFAELKKQFKGSRHYEFFE